jgi:hypothetical protein
MKFFNGGAELAQAQAQAQKPTYFCGLDLGQQSDFSALVILERRGFSPQNYTYDCKFLRRWELRTPYPQIVEDTVRYMNSEALNKGVKERPVLAVDGTGCGAAVIDLFRREHLHGKLVPILITGGNEVTKDSHSTKIPKRDLVATVAVVTQNRTLKSSEELPLTKTLTDELENFKAKTTIAGNDTYGAGAEWRVGNNDDLVLALSMALWCANDGVKPGTFWSFE